MADRDLRWMRLDNAAKVFPAARTRRWTNVFRLSVTLREPVDPALLQSALDVTVRRFPSIAVRLRRGMFWYYLEELEHAPKVDGDTPYPLSHMTLREIRRCALRVLYYDRRIAVEIFHALTDGNGGMVFLKTLTAEYLTQKYGIAVENEHGVLDRYEEPTDEELEDSFLKHEGPVSRGWREENTYRIRGTNETDTYLNLITGIIDTGKLLKTAKSYGVSLTAFMVSVIIHCIMELQIERVRDRRFHKPVKVLVPVNLRRFFDSGTLRNFALYIIPGIDPKMGDFTFEEIIKSVHHQMGYELTKKHMSTRITSNVRTEKSWAIKLFPLFVKNAAMKFVYSTIAAKKNSLTFSNLGLMRIPSAMEPYVQRFDFILGAQPACANSCGAVTYGDKIYINFARSIKETDFERRVFTFLRKLGVTALLESNAR